MRWAIPGHYRSTQPVASRTRGIQRKINLRRQSATVEVHRLVRNTDASLSGGAGCKEGGDDGDEFELHISSEGFADWDLAVRRQLSNYYMVSD